MMIVKVTTRIARGANIRPVVDEGTCYFVRHCLDIRT